MNASWTRRRAASSDHRRPAALRRGGRRADPRGHRPKIYPAARGAWISDIIFSSTKGTWLDVGKSAEKTADAVKQIGISLSHIDELSAIRRRHPVHPLYASYPDPVPVQVTKVYAAAGATRCRSRRRRPHRTDQRPCPARRAKRCTRR